MTLMTIIKQEVRYRKVIVYLYRIPVIQFFIAFDFHIIETNFVSIFFIFIIQTDKFKKKLA